ncbi:tRNA (adenosine(37)-N6)-threonylcarbamoyltransferase complex dimerization subunit type 1 TsaB [Solimicrobium silvestre]|uniref:tRNA threonylcarbamoyl adenosine modification protein YeaZ n=1 Tax=Solimicrobium silvestre TaxID=2099400 RepID=A0A2S9GUV1_9BURK|nr:tRNA (adenosine(37)-N6)-threonylcarbamoyltransferase complex dimerization subunit type 1 TsaB [Solimicrobium silvestre]PRC91507.1 tRNA threonylcarbamoyl adenosine modification protein YeaZ [Solimicrobium silvestre]
MFKILSIETSSELASAALLFGQKIIQRQTNGVTNHSQSILPMVQSLLQEAGITLSECDAIAFGSGPGSFTGVRTACGVVQGLAFGANLPVIPVVTLLALAEDCRNKTGANHVLAALDARMGEVYWAQYRYDEAQQAWATLVEPTLSAPALLVPNDVDGLALVGNGFAAYPDKFTLPVALLAAAQSAVPQAEAVARLGKIEFAAGRCYPAEQAQPLYLRNKIALTIAERAALTAANLNNGAV